MMRRLLATTMLIASLPGAGFAQSSLAVDTIESTSNVGDDGLGFRNGSFVAVPIPLSNPTVGTGLTLGAGYLFKADEGSDTSFFGVGVMRTDNGSEAAGAAVNLSLGDGRWDVALGAGSANLNYDLSFDGLFGRQTLPIKQSGDALQATLSYGFSDSLSFGLEATWLRTEITTERFTIVDFLVLPGFGISVEQVVAGPSLEWNTVDDSIYPTSGARVKLLAERGMGLDGFDAEFWRYTLQARGYTPVGERGVIATSSTFCEVDGDAPFFNQCIIGLTDGLRGFAIGEYFGPSLVSGQVEFRARFTERIGGTIFAGASAVADEFGALGDAELRAAGGVGLRYRLTQRFPLDFSVDAATNSEGENTTYIYVAQAF